MSQKAKRKCDTCRQAKKKCQPPERVWNEVEHQRCERCSKVGNECGPNLTQFDSDKTLRGEKRKAAQSLHRPAQPIQRPRHDLASPQPEFSFHDVQNAGGGASIAAFSLASDDGNHQHSPLARTVRHELSVDFDSLLEESYELLCKYQYLSHPKQTISLLVQDSTFSKDPARAQENVIEYLASAIEFVLDNAVRKVDQTHDSAERTLLLVQEAVQRFRRLANDPELLLKIEFEILEKRIHVIQRGNLWRGEQRITGSVCGKERPYHQQTLEMEKNEVVRRLESCSRYDSPETASTAGGDRFDRSKSAMKQAGGLMFSKETKKLLANSTDGQAPTSTSLVSHYISSQSLARHRRTRRQEVVEFPKLHRAILFGTELEARSWLESNERSVECVDFFKRTIAHVAAERGRVHLLEDILLEQRRSFDTRDAFNLTPLIIAVMHGHLDSCRLLLEAKFEREARDSTGRNLLSIACRRAHYHIVEYLVNHLEFPLNDYRGGYTCSPIHDAIESGNFQICRLLINLGADLNTPFNNKRPANLALEKGHDQILYLINKKAGEASITGLNSNGAAPAYTGFPSESNLQYNMVANNDHTFPQQYSPNGHMHDMTPYAPGFNAWTFSNLGHPGTDSASLGTS